MTAKTRAIPSLHRDSFSAKVPGSARCSRRVTQPPFIAGPLGFIAGEKSSVFLSNLSPDKYIPHH
jgi:hypothetical protein